MHPTRQVIFVRGGLHPEGSDRQWVYLAKALARRGIRSTLVTNEPLVAANAHYLPLLSESGAQFIDASSLRVDAPPEILGALDRLARELGFGEREVRHILRLVAAFAFCRRMSSTRNLTSQTFLQVSLRGYVAYGAL